MKQLLFFFVFFCISCLSMDIELATMQSTSTIKPTSMTERLVKPLKKVTAANLASMKLRISKIDPQFHDDVNQELARSNHYYQSEVKENTPRSMAESLHPHYTTPANTNVAFQDGKAYIFKKPAEKAHLLTEKIVHYPTDAEIIILGETLFFRQPKEIFLYDCETDQSGVIKGEYFVFATNNKHAVGLCNNKEIAVYDCHTLEINRSWPLANISRSFANNHKLHIQDTHNTLSSVTLTDENDWQYTIKKLHTFENKINSLKITDTYLFAFSEQDLSILSTEGNLLQKIPGKWRYEQLSNFGSWLVLTDLGTPNNHVQFFNKNEGQFNAFDLKAMVGFALHEVSDFAFFIINRDYEGLMFKVSSDYTYKGDSLYLPSRIYTHTGIELKKTILLNGWDYGFDPSICSKNDYNLFLRAIENCGKKGLAKQLSSLKQSTCYHIEKSKIDKYIHYINDVIKATPARTAAHIAHLISRKKLAVQDAEKKYQTLIKQCDAELVTPINNELIALKIPQLSEIPELQPTGMQRLLNLFKSKS